MYAHTSLGGQFYFNKTHMVPPCTNIMINEKQDKKASWDAHSCKVYDKKMQVEKICDTIELLPTKLPMSF